MLVKPSQDHDLRWTTKISHGVKLPYKLSVKATQNSTWDKAYFITHEKVLCTPHRKGAPSLRQSATVRCLELGLPEIEELPWTVTAQLWDFAIKTGNYLTFQTWKVLSKLLRDYTQQDRESEALSLALYRYEFSIRKPAPSLEDYISPLRSFRFDFLTALSITVEFAVSDLVKLYQIDNLGILEIINSDPLPAEDVEPRPKVGDRLIRAWAEKAVGGSHFKVLRVLRLWHFKDVTPISLGFLDSFPSLAIYDVCGCNFSRSIFTLNQQLEASAKDWDVTLAREILPLLTNACQEKTQKYAKSKGLRYSHDKCQSSPVSQKHQSTKDKQSCLGEKPPRTRLDGRFVWDLGVVERVPRGEQVQLRFQAPRNDWKRFSVPAGSHPRLSGKDLRRMPLSIYEGLAKVNADQDWFDCAEIKWRLFWESFQRAETGPCDFERTAFATFARIGELRDDEDLRYAGVRDLELAMFVGDDLVSPVPMACIQLGPEAVERRYPDVLDRRQNREENQKEGGLTFYKLNWSAPKAAGKEKENSLPQQKLAVGSRPRPRSVRPVKKQAIGDMLNGFTY